MRIPITYLIMLLPLLMGVTGYNEAGSVNTGQSKEFSTFDIFGKKALLATRFQSLQEFTSVVDVRYEVNGAKHTVQLTHKSWGEEVMSELEDGTTQNDLAQARDGSWGDKFKLLYKAPFAVVNRMDLKKVHALARWNPNRFGEGDVAFYDLAKGSADNINTIEQAYLTRRDSSEKGYINTFNHFTAQALITTLFSEEVADYVADVHERYTMPELTSGKFTEAQLTDSLNNPIDNYVDIINNEWGQEFGKILKSKYHITRTTHWTPQLLADYLNDIQNYYCWAFEIGFRPYSPSEQVIRRFSKKLNVVL